MALCTNVIESELEAKTYIDCRRLGRCTCSGHAQVQLKPKVCIYGAHLLLLLCGMFGLRIAAGHGQDEGQTLFNFPNTAFFHMK